MTTLKAARTAGGLVIAAAVGTAMAGGLHRPAPAAAHAARLAARTVAAHTVRAAPAGALWWHVAAFGVMTVVCLAIVRAYYRFRWLQLRAELADVDGWIQHRPAELRSPWGCPACGSVMPLTSIDQHQERSVCAAYERWVADTGGEDGRPVRAHTPPWVSRESATTPPDESIMAGGFDTLNTGMAGE